MLRVFEETALRKICGPQREKGTRDWKKLHNEELSDFLLFYKYYSVDQIKAVGMHGVCGKYGGGEYRVLVWNMERKGPHEILLCMGE